MVVFQKFRLLLIQAAVAMSHQMAEKLTGVGLGSNQSTEGITNLIISAKMYYKLNLKFFEIIFFMFESCMLKMLFDIKI